MVFSLDDSWLVLIVKMATMALSMSIVVWLIRSSSYNFYERSLALRSSIKSKRLLPVLSGVFASLVNVLFIWLMVQGAVMLVLGYLGVSPKQLMEWHYQKVSFGLVAVSLSLLVVIRDRAKVYLNS